MANLFRGSKDIASRLFLTTVRRPCPQAACALQQFPQRTRPFSQRMGIQGGISSRRVRLHESEAIRSQSPQFRTDGSRRTYKTVQQARTRYKVGPFSAVAVLIFLGTGVGMGLYFRSEKERVERKRIADATKGEGKPKVGGPFELVDQNGRPWSSVKEMGGKFSLVYFGFSHCPDICPEELDKMASMLDQVAEALPPSSSPNPDLLPVFITCDPARDTPAVLKAYLKEFHPRLVGLTGNWEQIKTVCRLYRVYFSTPPGVKPGMDYLVDHSIYFYLMDPEGDFVEAIGRQHTAEQGAKLIADHMRDWKGKISKE